MGRNDVVCQLREPLERRGISERELGLIKRLYPDRLLRETSGGPVEYSHVQTKAGFWRIFYRKAFPVDQFCAVYWAKAKESEVPVTLFSGDLFDESALEKTIGTITPAVLESKPHSKYYNWDSKRGASKGLGLGIALGCLLSLPLAYEVRIPVETIPFIVGFGAAGGFTGRYLGKRYGESNEQELGSKLPIDARFYTYGLNALRELQEEDKAGPRLSPEAMRFKRLLDAGLDIPKEKFLGLEETMGEATPSIKKLMERLGEASTYRVLRVYGMPKVKSDG